MKEPEDYDAEADGEQIVDTEPDEDLDWDEEVDFLKWTR